MNLPDFYVFHRSREVARRGLEAMTKGRFVVVEEEATEGGVRLLAWLVHPEDAAQ